MSYRKNPLYPPQGGSRIQGNESDSYHAYPRSTGGAKEKVEKYLDLLYRRKWLFLCSCLILCGAAVALVIFHQPDPTYQSSSFVMVDLSTRAGSGLPEFGETRDEFFSRNDRSISDELFILRTSSLLAKRVSDRIHEDHAPELSGKPESWLTDSSGELLQPEMMAGRLRGMVSFGQAQRTGSIIRLTAISGAPRDPSIVANLYAEEYVRLTREAGRQSVSGSLAFFEEQAANWRRELMDGEYRIQNYLNENTNVRLDQTGTLLVRQIADLEARRDDARIEMEMRKASLRDLEAELREIMPRVAEHMVSDLDRRMRSVQSEIIELEVQREQIRLAHRGPDVPGHVTAELRQIDTRLATLKETSYGLSQQYIEERLLVGTGDGEGTAYLVQRRRQALQEETAINSLEARIRVMENRIDQLNNELRNVPRQSIELAQLQRSRMHAERMYEMVSNRMLDARLAGETEQGGYVRIVERAGERGSPVMHDIRRNLILGVFLMLALAFFIMLTIETLDNRLYKPDDVRKKGFPLLSVVPNLKPLIHDLHRGKEFVEENGRRYATSLVSLLNPMTAVAESYRQLRTKIQFARPDKVVQSILITSPSMGEGKTVTAANLAVMMAQAGRETLLIDTDLYRPRIHTLFGMKSGAGLVQVLAGEIELNEAIQPTGIEGLSVLPAGRPVLESAKLLTDGRFRDVMAEVRHRYDCIIIDTPPLRAMSEGIFLAALCDGSIMVARAGATREGELELGFDLLDEVGAQMLGTVFNGFDLSMAFGYKYRYGNYRTYSQYSRQGYYQPRNAE